MSVASAKWANRTDWVIDGNVGSDENPGTAALPIRTVNEYLRRRGGIVNAAPVITGVERVLKITDPYVVSGTTFNGALGNYTSSTADDSAAISYWWSQGASGAKVYMPNGTYRVKSTGFTAPADGFKFFGDGVGSTRILCDDSNGNGADVFNITNKAKCELSGFTIDSLTSRTAGWGVNIQGGNTAYRLLSNLNISLGGHLIDVDMNNMFNGCIIQDNAGVGDWSSQIGSSSRRSIWRNFSSGGIGIKINTPHGASQVVRGVFLVGKTGATAAIHCPATGDATFDNVETESWTNNVLWDPTVQPAETVQLLIFRGCIFDVTTGDGFDLNPGNFTGVAYIDIDSCWQAGAGIGGSTSHGIHVRNNTPQYQVHIGGTTRLYANSGYGVRVENGIGTTKVQTDSTIVYAANTIGTSLYT